MTGFIMKIVGRLVVEWEEAHLDGDIRNMSIDARNRFWEAEYKKDLIGVAKSMWVPVKSVVDWHAMFEIDIDELNAESKMKILRARRVLLVKFVAACDITFLYRYDEENNLEDYLREGDGLIPRKNKALIDWVNFRYDPVTARFCMGLSDIPINRSWAQVNQTPLSCPGR